jgi:hypothetical protein
MAIIKPNNNTISAITALPAGVGGKVLQVVQVEYSSMVTVTSTTYTDTGLTASITPASSSNKVLVLVNQSLAMFSSSAEMGTGFRLLRDTSTIYGGVQGYQLYLEATGNSAGVQLYHPADLSYLDSPSSTSSVTYKTQIRQYQSGDTVRAQSDGMESTITLMEIAG